MNVLSLFDGMSCAQIALNRLGISAKYFSSEVDKFAIKVTQSNYPDTIQLGDVHMVDAANLPKIDLLVGGSPCQGFSFSGKQMNFNDPRSALFWEFVRVLKDIKPKYFLLENVRMKQEFQDVISNALGVRPIMINSSLVSAQNRVRLYWTNIEGIDQPEDKGIMLEDIIGDHYVGGAFRGRNIVDGKRVDYKGAPTVQRFEARTDGKSNCLTTVTKDTVVVPVIKSHGELIFKPHKSQCLDANYHKGADNHGQRTGVIELGHAELNGHDIIKRVYSPKGKAPTLTAVCGGNQEKKIAVDASHWRKLTTVECERLQTVPDGYTDGVSKTQRYKMIGNSFTVDVIAHLLKNIKE